MYIVTWTCMYQRQQVITDSPDSAYQVFNAMRVRYADIEVWQGDKLIHSNSK